MKSSLPPTTRRTRSVGLTTEGSHGLRVVASRVEDRLMRPTGTMLESLPAEIKLLILQSTDTGTLRQLVRSSPSFHSIYLSHRLQTLYTALQNEIGSDALFVAYTIERATGLKYPLSKFDGMDNFQSDAVWKAAMKFQFVFQAELCIEKLREEKLDLDLVTAIIQRHWNTQSIVSAYLSDATRVQERDGNTMSVVEADDLHLAFYVFDLYCLLFGICSLRSCFESKCSEGHTHSKFTPAQKALSACYISTVGKPQLETLIKIRTFLVRNNPGSCQVGWPSPRSSTLNFRPVGWTAEDLMSHMTMAIMIDCLSTLTGALSAWAQGLGMPVV